MREYNPKEIERRWQQQWEEKDIFKTHNKVEGKENYYVLEMFAYPSGNLHVGHLRNYTIGDAVARYKKMKGFNVLHPFGWDSFGLPAENAAIDNNAHPKTWTEKNIENMKTQLKLMGISYDWSREIATHKPEYSKWNQWMFIKMYEKGLVYKKKSNVNWCPKCNTVLANEQVEDGMCWRHSDTPVIQKELSQWYFKITEYADELLNDQKELEGYWPDKVLAMQKNWIGKSYGTEIVFKEESTGYEIPVFTTRPDTLFGVTYVVVAPEHPFVKTIIKDNESISLEVEKMLNEDKQERQNDNVDKKGIFSGKYLINPINNEKIPLWIGDYVLMDYGTGAVMAVPAHDQRDFDFAKKYKLPIKIVINPVDKKTNDRIDLNLDNLEEAYTGDGILVNSGEFNNLKVKEGKQEISNYLEKNNLGTKTINYRLHDWLISRQRYWGTPIPVLYTGEDEFEMEKIENLPIKLPEDVSFTGKGNPLETSEEYKNVTDSKGNKAWRETDTMDTFVDSSWYYLRYINPHLDSEPFNKDDVNNWAPVNLYIGGVEHAVLHLLYARFFHKVFRDLGFINTNEPFQKLLTQGMVLGQSYQSPSTKKYFYEKDVLEKDGKYFNKNTNEELIAKVEKMSKSKNNGVDPQEIVEEYGVDASRVFTLFAAPPEKELEWNMNGLAGSYRFINRLYLLINETKDFIEKGEIDIKERNEEDKKLQKKLHQTVKKITTTMDTNLHFNTAIASIMELLNDMTNYKQNVIDNDNKSSVSGKIWNEVLEKIILILSPFAPHVSDDLWNIIGNSGFTYLQKWPEYNEELTKETEYNLVVQINGKLRDNILCDIDSTKEEMEKLAFSSDKIQKHIDGKEILKVIVVPKKLVNIVLK